MAAGRTRYSTLGGSGSVPLVWHALALLNAWAAVAGQYVPAYALDAQGVIHFRGAIKSTAPATSTTFANLPVGFRPSSEVDLFCGSGPNGAIINVFCTAGGVLAAELPNGTLSTAITNLPLDNFLVST